MNNEEYFDDEEFKEMLADYERTVQSGQLVFMDVDDLADIAEYYHLKERYDESRQAMDRAIELEPDSVVALNYQLHDAIDVGDYAAAEEFLARMPDDAPEYIYCRAELWLVQGMVDKADEYLKKWLENTPKDEYQDYVVDVANLFTEYGDSEKGMEWMMRAYPEETDDFKELMGRTYYGLGAYDDSERIFQELIDKHPFQKRYWHALANTQYMKEDYGASVTSSEYAIAIDPEDPEGIMAKANALFRLDNFEEALKYYQRYSEKEPDDEFALLHEGSCHINLRHYKEAVECLLKAEQVAAPDSPYLAEIYQELAFAYGDQGLVGDALQTLDKTRDLDCDHDDLMVIRGHILLSNVLIDEAEAAFREAIINSDYSPKIYLRVAVSLLDCNLLEAAYKMFKHLLTHAEKDFDQGYSYMALCCHSMQRYDEYLDYLQQAVSHNPEEAKIVLAHLFPEDMKPDEYYKYAKKEQKQ